MVRAGCYCCGYSQGKFETRRCRASEASPTFVCSVKPTVVWVKNMQKQSFQGVVLLIKSCF